MDEDKLIASMIIDDFTPLTNALEQSETDNAKERGKEQWIANTNRLKA